MNATYELTIATFVITQIPLNIYNRNIIVIKTGGNMKNLLGRSNTSIKGFIIAVLMVCLSNGFAKSYNWDNISQQQYIDNLVACETQLQEYRWSKNI